MPPGVEPGQAGRQTGRDPGILLVPAAGVDEGAHQPGGEQREGHSGAQGQSTEGLGGRGGDHTAVAGHLSLVQHRLEGPEPLARQRGQDGDTLATVDAVGAELRGGAGGGLTPVGRPELAEEALGAVGGPGAGHRGADVFIGAVVGRADEVVVELRVVLEPVDDRLEVVAHDVGLGARHGLVGVSDADPHGGAVGGVAHGHVGRGSRRRGGGDLADRVLAVGVLAVLVPGTHGDEALDTVPVLPRRELPGDVLGDVGRPVLVEGEVDVEPRGEVVGRWPRRRRSRRR